MDSIEHEQTKMDMIRKKKRQMDEALTNRKCSLKQDCGMTEPPLCYLVLFGEHQPPPKMSEKHFQKKKYSSVY